MICSKIKNEIRSHALRESPNECCGLLLLKTDQLFTFPCKNISVDKKNEFSICPKDYLKASLIGKIIGIYHSHGIQEDSFSELDKQVSQKLKLKNIVYIVKKDKFEEFFPNDLCCKYIDREFLIGKSDCLTLISDYYKEELGITLSEYPRDEKWDKNYNEFIQLKLKKISGNKFEDFLENENLIKIENISFAKKHDIIVFKYLDNYPSHFGIYLDHGYILHQPRNKKSTIEKLTNAEKRRIYCFLRHKELC